MLKFSAHLLVSCLLIAGASAYSATDSTEMGNKMNPYHEQQLQEQIRKCASGVLACTDMEMRCVKQQELCQLLIRTERYDEAIQVASNIAKTDNADGERKAAHHFLIAEIYNRKMKNSRSLDDMEKSRQAAISAAQEVVDQKYPAKWLVSEHARDLIRTLSDSRQMSAVRQRVASRQGALGDSAKEAIAEAQRKYLDSTQGRNRGNDSPVASREGAQFQRVAPAERPVEEVNVASRVQVERPSVSSMPSKPEVTRVISPVRVEATEGQTGIGERLQNSGLLTSQPGAAQPSVNTVVSQPKGPLTVNGQVANNTDAVDDIAKNNLAQLLEAAKKRKEQRSRSPYAAGEGPISIRK